MQKRIIFYTILLIFVCACRENPPDAKKENNTKAQNLPQQVESYRLDSNKIAILPIDTSVYSLPKNISALELTLQELAEVEKILKKCVDPNTSEIEEKAKPLLDLSKYKRQYIPYINKQGEKLVWVNCFCADRFEYWKKTIVQVMDGGSCFFNVTINLTEKNFDQIRIHGVA